MGLAVDPAVAGDSSLPHHPAAFSTAPHPACHPSVRDARRRRRRRYQPVCSPRHIARCHHRHRQHRGRGHRRGIGRTGCSVLVLDCGRIGHCHEIFRSAVGCEISRQDQRWHHARRAHVCPGVRSRLEALGCAVCHLHGMCCFWHRQQRPKQCHLTAFS